MIIKAFRIQTFTVDLQTFSPTNLQIFSSVEPQNQEVTMQSVKRTIKFTERPSTCTVSKKWWVIFPLEKIVQNCLDHFGSFFRPFQTVLDHFRVISDRFVMSFGVSDRFRIDDFGRFIHSLNGRSEEKTG